MSDVPLLDDDAELHKERAIACLARSNGSNATRDLAALVSATQAVAHAVIALTHVVDTFTWSPS